MPQGPVGLQGRGIGIYRRVVGPWRLRREDCRAGEGKAVPDLLGANLRVLFVGINPSNCSGAVGLHFATPGNRFWPVLAGAGFTDRQLRPDETAELLRRRIGITNLVNRATANASLVTADELLAGAERLQRTVAERHPRSVAVLGISAYRTAFAEPTATMGRQPVDLERVPLWVLPNPSGLNAHYQLPQLVAAFAALRASLDAAT